MENKSGDNKNKMAEVAALWKLELEEEFDIEGLYYNPYKFTHEGLCDCDGEVMKRTLGNLLRGELTIIKKPWEPKIGETYWIIDAQGDVYRELFDSDEYDHALLYSGNCFRTSGEALANKEPIMEKFGWK